MGLVFSSPAEAVAAIGQDLGHSGWILVDQARINAFADATGDHQWIHVDTERAKSGPFGRTVAHGYLSFSLINMVLPELFLGKDMKLAVNYGANKVRFPAPLLEGSRVRVAGRLLNAEMLDETTVHTTVGITVEIEGGGKPACVAEILGRYFF